MRRNFTVTIRELSRAFTQAFNAYRPEQHYMRGPGPKCRAKQSGAPAKTNRPGVPSARPARVRA